jgi:hypothetical protein
MLIVFICTSGRDADIILKVESSLFTDMPVGHSGVTIKRFALVPPLKLSLKKLIEFI